MNNGLPVSLRRKEGAVSSLSAPFNSPGAAASGGISCSDEWCGCGACGWDRFPRRPFAETLRRFREEIIR